MNVKKALKILKSKGYQFQKIDGQWFMIGDWGEPYPYDDRALINFAREFTSEGQRTPVKSNVKSVGKRKERQRVREALAHDRYDDIPLKKPIHKEDIWNWD